MGESVRRVALLGTMLMLVGSVASAQQMTDAFEQLGSLVRPGDTIEVTQRDGRRTKGRLGELTASSLELLVRKPGSGAEGALISPFHLSKEDVRSIRIERKDSLLNGALIGFTAGAAPGLFFIAGRSRGSDPIQGADIAFQIVAVPGALGAAIGALCDALHVQRRLVYVAPALPPPRVRLSPVVRRSAAGATVSVRF